MLRELSIRNFALIEQAQLTFENGFHVLTGETGAGKSIFVDALTLVSGGRASSEYVRHGAQKAEIEALFEIDPMHCVNELFSRWGMDLGEKSIVIRREVTSTGKSSCRINGRIVTVTMLKEIGSKLLDISGQHEHQTLLRRDEHLEWLDQFGGELLLGKKKEYQEIFNEFQKLKKEQEELTSNQRELEQNMDIFRYQLEEIRSAQLLEGEDDSLESERMRLASMERLLSDAQAAYQLLHGEQKGLDHTRSALSHIEELVRSDENASGIHQGMEQLFYQLEDVARDLTNYLDTLNHDPVRLAEVDERIQLINQLKRKYGDTIEDILCYEQNITLQLDGLIQKDQQESILLARLYALENTLEKLASVLTSLRKEAAKKLETRMHNELSDLHMKSTIFHVSFLDTEIQSIGKEMVEFQISPNPGEPLRPMVKIASGGELSRLMLALKCIFSDSNNFHTLIFDEIDTGVSGRAAQLIAEKIAKVAKHNQVLCVTHLPQVACMADVHLYINKEILQERTHTNVYPLDAKKQILELARMLSGVEVTQKTYEHAEEMVCLAAQLKERI